MDRQLTEKELLLRDTLRSKGLMMAILFTIQAILTIMRGSILGFIMQTLICVGAWLAAFCKPAGAGIVRVVMTIYRITMYVLAGLILLCAAIILFSMFRFNVYSGVMIVLISAIVGTIVSFIYSKTYANAALVSADIGRRIASCNKESVIYVVDEVSLTKNIITIIVFQGIALLFGLSMNTMFGSVFSYMINELTYEIPVIGSFAGNFIRNIFGIGALNILNRIFGIVLCGCGLAFVAQYKRVIIK